MEEEKNTLQSCLPPTIKIPKSYKRYLNYPVERREENQFVVKSPQGAKVFFQVADSTLKKVKQEPLILGKADEDLDVPNLGRDAPQDSPGNARLLEERLDSLEASLGDVVSLLEKTLGEKTFPSGEVEAQRSILESLSHRVAVIETSLADAVSEKTPPGPPPWDEITKRVFDIEERMGKLENNSAARFAEFLMRLERMEREAPSPGKQEVAVPVPKASDRYRDAQKLLRRLRSFLLFLGSSSLRLLKFCSAFLKSKTPVAVKAGKGFIRYLLPRWKVVLPICLLLLLLVAVGTYYKVRRRHAGQPQQISPISQESSPVSEQQDPEDTDAGPVNYDRQSRAEKWSDSGEGLSGISRLVESARSGPLEKRKEAIRDLAERHGKQAGQQLLLLLQDPDVCWDVLRALGKIQYNSRLAVVKLNEIALDRERPQYIREEAIATLGKIKSESAAVSLQKILKNTGEDPYVRANAAAALGEIGKTATFKDLLEALSDTEPAVQTEAARALGKVDYPPAHVKMLEILRSSAEIPVRQAVAKSLRETENRERAEERVLALLALCQDENENRHLRATARETMELLLPKVSPALRSQIETVRESGGESER